MDNRERSASSRFARRWIVACCALALMALCAGAYWHWHRLGGSEKRYVTTGVRRADLFPTITATGRTESAKRTVIQCQLENITVGVRGQRLAAGGASMLLSVAPEGSEVKQGDVLAVLDSSDYEELLRTQRISVERAVAETLQAKLAHEVAGMALQEFQDGLMRESLEDYQGRILLARSDLERAQDRLSWSRRMKAKGYAPATLVATDAFREAQLALNLAQQEAAFSAFQKYTAPKTLKELEGAVKGAEAILEYQKMRLQRQQSRLALLEKQVQLCTIRAPHDGMLIYASNSDREVYIEPGMPVRQKQELFYLPDLSQMEVIAMLHESIVEDIDAGLKAHVQIEGMSGRSLEGYVETVAPIPIFNWRTDVRYFEGIVKLENPPHGLKPGMTAEVTISMPRRERVLAVPAEAITSAEGHDVCFVVHETGLERREVKLGQVTLDLAEVTAGLEEGEEVVLRPTTDEEVQAETLLTSRESSPAREGARRFDVQRVAAASN
jgi:HlyD family secretion protein